VASRGPKVARRRHSRLLRPPRRKEFLQDLDESFAEIRIEIADARDLGDRALFLGRFRGRGKESGAETRSPIAYLVDFRNGKVTRVVSYLDHQEALKEAGLQG
jgi:ketosteroid isomerase-like protein